jgi:hypothetical protein
MKKYIESNIPPELRLQVRYLNTIGDSWLSFACLYNRKTGEIEATGEAKCGPKDNPTRSIGRAICVGRALKNYQEGLRT